MKIKLAILGFALACLMLLSLAAPSASAEYTTPSTVYLLDNAGEVVNATTDWYFTIERIGYVANDASMELNATVTAYLHNGTGSADLTHNYTLRITLTDSASTAVTDDLDLYVSSETSGYIIITNTSLATLVEDSNATIVYALLDADDGDAILDTFTDNIPIVTARALGPLVAMIPMLIAVMVIGAVFSFLGGAFGKIQSSMRFGKSKGKRRK